jgi:uncharacterized protein
MKWTLPELRKKQYSENTFKEVLDLSAFIDENDDILAISPVTVDGEFEVEDNTYYHFDMTIKATLTVACAITLEPVEVPLDFDITETFTEDERDEYRQIEGITIDLLPIIWSNIYLEKPLRVVSKDATFRSDKQSEKKDNVNPAFKDLEKYK